MRPLTVCEKVLVFSVSRSSKFPYIQVPLSGALTMLALLFANKNTVFSTVKKFSEAAKLEKAGKDVAAEFAKREAARSFKTGGVEIDRVDTALGVVTIAKAVCDDVKNDSCLETLKAGGSLVADLASQTMKKPCSLLGGKNLCVMGKWNSLTLKTSNDFKLAKLNTVTTAVGAVQAVWNSYKEGSAEPLVDFVGSTTGNVVGQMVGRSVGGKHIPRGKGSGVVIIDDRTGIFMLADTSIHHATMCHWLGT